MTQPFAWLSQRTQKRLSCISTTIAVGCLVALLIQGAPLRNRVATNGVISLQLAFTEDRARAVLASWSHIPRTAWLQIMIDFPMLVAYPIAISLGCATLSQSLQGLRARVALACSWLVLFAGPLDLVEDLASLQMLSHGATGGIALTVSVCASLKFLAVIPSLGFLVVAGLRLRAQQSVR